MLADLVARNRSYRRFQANRPLGAEILRDLIALARLCPSAANRQPLRFMPISDPPACQRVFPHLRWASYLQDWAGPAPGERPAAYVIILGDREVASPVRWDDAIAAQTMLLGAVERGLGGCMLAAIQRDDLRAALAIADRYEILLVVALGYPAETVVVEPVPASGDIKYWRDAGGVHHVPKRDLDDLIVMPD